VPARCTLFAHTLARMIHTRSLVLCAAALCAVACGGSGYPEPSTPALLSSSSYSAPSSASFSGPSIPSRDTRGDLVVRPDLVCVPFVLRLEGPDVNAVIAALEKASQAVRERFVSATNGQATTNMLGVNVAHFGTGKAKSEQPVKFVVTVDGNVEVPLVADANYWTRARLLSSLVQASTDPKPLVPPPTEDQQPQLDAAFGSPEVKMRNPEAFRSELVKRWVERTRAFAKAAESEKAPLSLINCDPPQAISQTPISIEQVGLTLAVQCRVDVARISP